MSLMIRIRFRNWILDKFQVDHEYDSSIQKAEEGQNYPSITPETFNENPRQVLKKTQYFVTDKLFYGLSKMCPVYFAHHQLSVAPDCK